MINSDIVREFGSVGVYDQILDVCNFDGFILWEEIMTYQGDIFSNLLKIDISLKILFVVLIG